MDKEVIGLVSGFIVIVSVIPYAIRTHQAKIRPNPTSWILWTLIGLTLLLTYKSSSAESNVWPAVFGFTNPLLITIFLVKNREKWKKLEGFEIICLIIGLISLSFWSVYYDDRDMAQYALYIAILADACAAIPTVAFVWRFPKDDRPFAWTLFAIGYGLAIFAIPESTISNFILPLYMFFGALFIVLPLILYRLKNNIHFREWV